MSYPFFLAVLLSIFLQAPVPEGFKAYESKPRGLALAIPTKFEPIPVPPDETYVQLKFTQKEQVTDPRKFRPELWILYIEKAAPVTGAPQELSEEEKAKEKERERFAEKKFQTWESYSAQFFPDWSTRPDGNLEISKDKKMSRLAMIRNDGSRKGVVYSMNVGKKDLIVIGMSTAETFPEYQKIFERCAKTLRITEVKDTVGAEIDAHYRVNRFRGVEYRKAVIRKLPPGWKFADTENFIVVYDIKDETVIAKIKNDLEVIRTKFIEVFPPVGEIDAVSTVRVCKDYDEFLKFSQAEMGTRGYWNAAQEELVFYDAANDNTLRNAGTKYTYSVLYHEAFHQYIYYSCGSLDPHSWFNEGYGDYFGGSVIGKTGRKVDRIEANGSRVGAIKKMIAEETYAPLKDLVKFPQEKYYERVGFYYAQGWSLVYFLSESPVVKKDPVWKQILPTYFNTLKSSYQAALKAMQENTPLDMPRGPRAYAQEAALEVAFKDVNFEALEKAWIEFINKIPDPEEKAKD